MTDSAMERLGAVLMAGPAVNRTKLSKRKNAVDIDWVPGAELKDETNLDVKRRFETTSKLFEELKGQVHSWISYKRQRNEEEARESHRIALQYPLIEAKSALSHSQDDCENEASCRQNDPLFDSENSSIDSVPSSSPSSPVNSVTVEIGSPDESMQCQIRVKNGAWDLTPAFSPMKDACADGNIQYAKNLSFSNVKSAITDASKLTDVQSGDCPHIMPSICI